MAVRRSSLPVEAQENASDTRLSVGGYGEVAMSRNFYSDNVYRYSNPTKYKDDPSHGRFDVPHAVLFIGYDFGHGWSMQTEIEFEHTGTGCAVEKEFTEAGEWEQEVEKGGEVALEQFWLQKSFRPWLNLRIGHFVVPVGALNNAHEPFNFFTVYRPEGESTILPSTWHDTGIGLWGEAGNWSYEFQFISGLDAFMFNRDNFIKYGAASPYEFQVANNYGFAARIDNRSIKNLRLGVSGYYGNSMHNSFPNDLKDTRYKDVKGRTWIGSFDFSYNGGNLIVRGNADYGRVDDAVTISTIKRNMTSNNAPYKKTPVGQSAVTYGAEAGYDILGLSDRIQDKLYLFVGPAGLHFYRCTPHRCRHQLAAHTPDNGQGRVLGAFPQRALQQRAVRIDRHRIHGIFQITNNIKQYEEQIHLRNGSSCVGAHCL